MDIDNNINNPDFMSFYKKNILINCIIFLIFLNQILYLFFVFQSDTIIKFGEIFYVSYFPYFLIFVRYFYSLIKRKYTDPVEFFAKDLQFIILFIIYLITVLKIVY